MSQSGPSRHSVAMRNLVAIGVFADMDHAVAGIEYRAKSAEGKMRHPFFEGIRERLMKAASSETRPSRLASHSSPRLASTLRHDFSSRCCRREHTCGADGFYYFFSLGATAGGDESSSAGVVPLSSDAPTHSPAQLLVPLTVPTSLHPIGARGFAWTIDFPPTIGFFAGGAP